MLAGASIVVAACGPGADDASEPSVETTASPVEPAADPSSPGSTSTSQPTTTEAPATATGNQTATPTPTTLAPQVDPTTTVPGAVWPDDGCNADNSPTPTESADGPAPIIELRAESANSPLPDLAVRRINCNGGWVNLRNEIPSALPLLVWFWAPH